MPLYNAERFVMEAVQSILHQRYTDFELIVVDDGSTDEGAALVASIGDDRIRLIRQPNKGIAAALNTGLALARGALIARMDADDVALAHRLDAQVAFMDVHPDVGLLGTWATIEDQEGRPLGVFDHPTDHATISYRLLFDAPFVHPSMMIRRHLLDTYGGYDGDATIFEDHDLWRRLVPHTRAANLPSYLLRYRRLPNSLSHKEDRRTDRLVEGRVRCILHAYPQTPRSVAMAASEFGLRHRSIDLNEFRAVHRLLVQHAQATLQGSSALSTELGAIRQGMLGYRLIAHRSQVHRVLDRAIKEVLVRLPL
jgi:glycosyltransferase involved in cell wall biosynthesis